jgi:hypothetical protein
VEYATLWHRGPRLVPRFPLPEAGRRAARLGSLADLLRLCRLPAPASRRTQARSRRASTSACVRSSRLAECNADLEARAIDIAIIPSDDIPPRFETRLHRRRLVIAMR